jgi:hypothetical protein
MFIIKPLSQTLHYGGSLKRLILFAVLVFALPPFIPLQAQILNAGFETWAGGAPSSWLTNNAPGFYTPITQSSDAHSGSSALKGATAEFSSVILAPNLFAGDAGLGFGTNARYSSITGYFKYTSVGGDSLFVDVIMNKGLTAIGGGVYTAGGTVSTYTKFTVPVAYATSDVPDNVSITFAIVPASGSLTLHLGTTFLIDDIAFGGTTSVSGDGAPVPTALKLAQNYPNPFNPSTRIAFSIPQSDRVTLKVFDVLGNEVSTLVDREMAAGIHSETWDAKNNPSGVYFYRLTAGSFSETKRLVLMK